MLGHSEVDMKVSDIGMEPVESDGCRKVSEANRDINSVRIERSRLSFSLIFFLILFLFSIIFLFSIFRT